MALGAEQTILVVDDEAALAHYVRKILTDMGFSAAVALSGEEAIEHLVRAPYALVLTDMGLPGMDGMQLLAHVRSHFPTTDVLVMTGFTNKYEYEKVIKAGAVDYLVKPIDTFELKAKLGRVFRDQAVSRKLNQEVRERQQAEATLHELNAELEERVAARTAELAATVNQLNDLARQHCQTIADLRSRDQELAERNSELQETNTALRVMLRRREEEHEELRREVRQSVLDLVGPLFDGLAKSVPPALLHSLQTTHLQVLQVLANQPTPSLAGSLLLTPREREIFQLIEQGHSSRQIADSLGLSTRTVESHRDMIRKKIGIKYKKSTLKKFIMLHS